MSVAVSLAVTAFVAARVFATATDQTAICETTAPALVMLPMMLGGGLLNDVGAFSRCHARQYTRCQSRGCGRSEK